MVRDAGLEPANLSVLGPKPSAFANFASRARKKRFLLLHPDRCSGQKIVWFPEFQLRLLKKPVRRIFDLRGTDRGPAV